MGLKLLSALLPRDYREQVLGDLTEGNYRVRDIVRVLPSIWISAARRSLQVPALAHAADGELQKRVNTLERRLSVGKLGNVLLAFSLARGLAGTEGILSSLFVLAASAAFSLPLFLAIYKRIPPVLVNREEWVAHHRKQLLLALDSARWNAPLIAWAITIAYGLWSTWQREPSELLLRTTRSFAVLAALLFIHSWQARRYRIELEGLQ